MDNKFFGIGSTYRSTIPDAKRATGFGATQEPFEYINQALFELKTDHIIGTAAQLTLGQCTCKYQSSDQTLRDSSGTEVTLTDGDRVYIIGLDTLTADFDLSAYDRLRVTGDPSVALGNGSHNLAFGDNARVDVAVNDPDNITVGSNCRCYANGYRVGDVYINKGSVIIRSSSENGIAFSSTPDGDGVMQSELFDDYEEGTWTPALRTVTEPDVDATYTTQVGFYRKVGSVVHIWGTLTVDSINDADAGYIIGLPYQNIAQNTPVVVGPYSSLNASYTQFVLVVLSGAVQLRAYRTQAAGAAITSGNFAADGTSVTFSGSYITA